MEWLKASQRDAFAVNVSRHSPPFVWPHAIPESEKIVTKSVGNNKTNNSKNFGLLVLFDSNSSSAFGVTADGRACDSGHD